MRLVVDGRALGDASAMRGIGRYLRGVLPPLAAQDDLQVAVLATACAEVPGAAEKVRVRRSAPDRLASVEHELRLVRDLRRARPDVVLSPALDPPRSSSAPWVQTLHDVFPLVSDLSSHVERRRWKRYRDRFRRAAAIIAVSEYSADQASEVLDLDRERVHVAHHGVDSAFCPGEGPDREAPYILHVGEFDPRKAFEDAFDVVATVAGAGLPHRLKMAGRITPFTAPTIDSLLAASRRPDRVDLLGYVSDVELAGLYRGASALVVSSRYEGFGFAAAEAMASGIPVVAYANTAVTEVVGTGGLLVQDGVRAELAEAVVSLLRDDALQQVWASRARERSSAFTWAKSAGVHHRVLLDAALHKQA